MPTGKVLGSLDSAAFMSALKLINPLLDADALIIARATGELVVGVAKSLAPVDTDALQQDIKVVDSGIDGKGAWVDVGTREPYALYQEFGTSHNPAHPFMRPAIAQITGLGGITGGKAANTATRLALKRKPRVKKTQ